MYLSVKLICHKFDSITVPKVFQYPRYVDVNRQNIREKSVFIKDILSNGIYYLNLVAIRFARNN